MNAPSFPEAHHAPIDGSATLPSPRGVSCLCNEVALHIMKQAVVVVLDPARIQIGCVRTADIGWRLVSWEISCKIVRLVPQLCEHSCVGFRGQWTLPSTLPREGYTSQGCWLVCADLQPTNISKENGCTICTPEIMHDVI